MIGHVIAFSIRHRLIVIVAAVALAILGVRAIRRLPVDAIPDLSEKQVLVFASWPGHGPREVEDQLTYPLALRLQGIPGVKVVRSSSEIDYSLLHVIFEEEVTHAKARERVTERLANAELPPGVVPALGPDAAATGQVFWYTLEAASVDPGRLRAVQDWYVKPQLAGVAGVAEVATVGGSPIEYQIEPDPLRMKDRGVSLEAVTTAINKANHDTGGNVIHQGNAEIIVRAIGRLGAGPDDRTPEERTRKVVADLRLIPVLTSAGTSVTLAEVANISVGVRPRRGSLEKDGNEVCGGVAMMRQGENPLEVTRRLREKILEIRNGLPDGVRIVPIYDRTTLVENAISTVTGTLLEAMLVATVCVVLILRHGRSSFVITLTLPLVALSTFLLLDILGGLGSEDSGTNIMSLAGLTISIGVLVDASVVMTENVLHQLRLKHGDQPVRGDTRELILPACRMVGRPIFFAIAIMLLSFLPIFALGGIEGRMFRPLALAKTFALLSVAILSITVTPALCTVFIRGKIPADGASMLVRGVTTVYRPVLAWLFDHPGGILWVIAGTFVIGSATFGNRPFLLGVLFIVAVGGLPLIRRWNNRVLYVGSLTLVALIAEQRVTPPGRELMIPLDEGMTMDMPITVPRASITQTTDDMKARDMILCRFPEVDMVVGKAGRAETSTDPAPLDMIETMVNFRPAEHWPKRKVRMEDVSRATQLIIDRLTAKILVERPANWETMQAEIIAGALTRYDVQQREVAYQSNRAFESELGIKLTGFVLRRLTANVPGGKIDAGDISALHAGHGKHWSMRPTVQDIAMLAEDVSKRLSQSGKLPPGTTLNVDRSWLGKQLDSAKELIGSGPASPYAGLWAETDAEYQRLWREHLEKLNADLRRRAGPLLARIVLEEIIDRCPLLNGEVANRWNKSLSLRTEQPRKSPAGNSHHGGGAVLPDPDPVPEIDFVQDDAGRILSDGLLLWRKERSDLTGFGGELDKAVQMPGWTNVWTMPIQNRVDMLATGVNTDIGVRVLGANLKDVVKASRDVAALLKTLPGAADVVADPIRDKGYIEIKPDPEKAARIGVSPGEIARFAETALGGTIVATTSEGRERHPVRVRFSGEWRVDVDTIRQLPIMRPSGGGTIPLSTVADVTLTEGPSAIKGENGRFCNYVRLNVRGMDTSAFVEEAKKHVSASVRLPSGVHLEWTGHFEHEARSRQTLIWIVPSVVALIALLLWLTFFDLADAALIMIAVPGALAGGLIVQAIMGAKFSVTIWVGYAACFGMATATGVIMLVYLRDAVERAGGFSNITPSQLRQAVLDGATQRLRPKMLTEATTILGLAPLLWATGVGSEVLRPMALPVIGGLLIADEVIDLFLPVLFYRVRLRRLKRQTSRDPR